MAIEGNKEGSLLFNKKKKKKNSGSLDAMIIASTFKWLICLTTQRKIV
jgi:hypothetical protein